MLDYSLETVIKHPLDLWYENENGFSLASQIWYGSFAISGISLIAALWIFSKRSLSFFKQGLTVHMQFARILIHSQKYLGVDIAKGPSYWL